MSRYANLDAAEWVARHNGGQSLSPLGRKLAYIVSCGFGGIYNALTSKQCQKGVWNSVHEAHVTLHAPDMATFDFSELTTLVYLAHRLGVRLSLAPIAPRYVRIGLIPGDGSATSGKQPTIAMAIEKLDHVYGDWPERLTGAPITEAVSA